MVEPARAASRKGLQWILRNDVTKWVFLGILIGIVAGVGSIAFYFLIKLMTGLMLTGITGFVPPEPLGEGGSLAYTLGHYRWYLLPISLAAGGILSGLIVYNLAPEAEGHGTDAAISAFHNNNGKIRRRVPIVKLVASAITIGSGGSAGREGPTAQIAAGFGSFVADVFSLNDHDRRIAEAAGIGAGIGSIFMAPLGGALLSTEILYRRDFEVEALIPSIIASVVGYSIFGYLFQYRPIFYTDPSFLFFERPESLLAYALVGILAGLLGKVYVNVFYGIQGLFRKWNITRFAKPAIGGLLVGLIAIKFPQVLGLGYGWVQLLLNENLYLMPLYILIILIFVKIVATSLTIGSGGSGGVFAPGIVIGSFFGAAMGIILHPLFPYLNIVEFTIVGMISFFGGVSKAPISVLIMGTEMTGSFALFLPLMLSTTLSYFASGVNTSIYRAQVLDRAHSPAHAAEYERPIMDQVPVYKAMRTEFNYVTPDDDLRSALPKLRETRTKNLLVMNGHSLKGILSLDMIKSGMDVNSLKVSDVMSTDVPTIRYDANIHEALDRLIRSDRGILAVIDEDNTTVKGIIGLPDIAEAYNREIRRIKHELMQGEG